MASRHRTTRSSRFAPRPTRSATPSAARSNLTSSPAPRGRAAGLVLEDYSGLHQLIPNAVGFREVLHLACGNAICNPLLDLRVTQTNLRLIDSRAQLEELLRRHLRQSQHAPERPQLGTKRSCERQLLRLPRRLRGVDLPSHVLQNCNGVRRVFVVF